MHLKDVGCYWWKMFNMFAKDVELLLSGNFGMLKILFFGGGGAAL